MCVCVGLLVCVCVCVYVCVCVCVCMYVYTHIHTVVMHCMCIHTCSHRSTDYGQTFVNESSKFPPMTVLDYTVYRFPNNNSVSVRVVAGYPIQGLIHKSNFSSCN